MTTRCFAHQHMTPDEYGIYCFARMVAHGSGIFFGDGRAIAQAFRGTSKTGIYRKLKSLVRDGWMETLVPSVRQESGVFSCARYRVVDHDEWVTKYGSGQCVTYPGIEASQPVPPVGQVNDGQPVPPAGQASPKIDVHLSQNGGSPVPKSRFTCPASGTEVNKEKLEKENLEGESDFSTDENQKTWLRKMAAALSAKKAMDEQILRQKFAADEQQRLAWKRASERQAGTQLPEPAKRVI